MEERNTSNLLPRKWVFKYKGSGWILIFRENIDTLFGNLQKIANQFLIAAGIIEIISVIIILLIARNISLPMSKLMAKVIDLGRGNYNSIIEIKSSDEIGELHQILN